MSNKKMLRQEWICEGCGLAGTTQYDPDAGVFDVVRQIRNHHENLASRYAPTCHFDIDQTRVRNPRLLDQYEWNRLVSEIGRKTQAKRTS